MIGATGIGAGVQPSKTCTRVVWASKTQRSLSIHPSNFTPHVKSGGQDRMPGVWLQGDSAEESTKDEHGWGEVASNGLGRLSPLRTQASDRTAR
jgi:hypothetical protein